METPDNIFLNVNNNKIDREQVLIVLRKIVFFFRIIFGLLNFTLTCFGTIIKNS